MRRYLSFWGILTCLILLAISGFNSLVDPYRFFGWIDLQGLNQIKPAAGNHGTMGKAYQVLRVKPVTLILGNSRAEVGFDPNNPDWPEFARPVYNLALPGTGTHTSLLYLQHVLAAQSKSPPKLIVWGIDFMDFLIDTKTAHQSPFVNPKKSGNRLLLNSDGSINSKRFIQQFRDGAESVFSLNAFIDAVYTLNAQQDRFSENLTNQGFNPMKNYLKITQTEGYWAVFQQRNIENAKAYINRPYEIYNAQGSLSSELKDLRQIIALCREHNIELKLIIYPYHAHLLEIISMTGHWDAFETWKRAVLKIVQDELTNGRKFNLSLWDFSLYNDFTQSSVPAKNDKKAVNPWYWEAGHFKSELGDKILSQIFGKTKINLEFGIPLNPDNIDALLLHQRELAKLYRQNNPNDISNINLLVEAARTQKSH